MRAHRGTRHFGGIYTSTRTLNRGTRVERRRFLRADRSGNVGVVAFVTRDAFGRSATVRWDDGSEQEVLTSDLRRAR